MAKKSRRSRKRQKARAVQPAQTRPRPVAPADEPDSPAVDFGEYRYVMVDLQRVAILAGALFALLVVLSFVIR